jgi:hypothetical protein
MDTVESSAISAHEPLDLAKRIEAIRQRTTRGMLTYNTGEVHRLEGGLWAVPSTRGGYHQVDLAAEECDCEDRLYFGRDHGIACRHVYAAAIANATRRSGIKLRSIPVSGDGIKAAAKASAKARFPRSRSTGRGENGKGVRPEESLRGVRANLEALDRLASRLGV